MSTQESVARLESSRAHLRDWLEHEAGRTGSPGATKADAGHGGRQWHPVAQIVIEALRAWWRLHPLRSATLIFRVAVVETIEPLVRQRPLATVGAAAVAGALIVWLRPWRNVLKPALFAGLLSQLLSHALTRQTASHDPGERQP